jgi:predicted nucleic acid-binding protein
MEKSEIVVSTQVINEFIVVMTGKVSYPLSLETVESHVKKFRQVFDIHPIQISDCIKALSIAKRYKFSYWDSLIVAAARNSGCSLLYTEDMQSGQTIEEKLTIINPFFQESVLQK